MDAPSVKLLLGCRDATVRMTTDYTLLVDYPIVTNVGTA